MAYLHDQVYIGGLVVLTATGDRVDLCSQEPTTYEEAMTYSLAHKAAPTIGSPEPRDEGGWQVPIAGIVDGEMTGDGEGTCWAVVDTVGEQLLATYALQSPVQVVSGNPLVMTAFAIGIPAPE